MSLCQPFWEAMIRMRSMQHGCQTSPTERPGQRIRSGSGHAREEEARRRLDKDDGRRPIAHCRGTGNRAQLSSARIENINLPANSYLYYNQLEKLQLPQSCLASSGAFSCCSPLKAAGDPWRPFLSALASRHQRAPVAERRNSWWVAGCARWTRRHVVRPGVALLPGFMGMLGG